MKQIMKFSALLMIFLLLGVGNALAAETESIALENMSVNVTYDKTGVIPGDIVNITVDYNRTVDHANISIINSFGSLLENKTSMNPLGADNNSFAYNYTIPTNITDIILGLDVDIYAFDENNSLLGGGPAQDSNVFTFDPERYLTIEIEDVTGPFIPGNIVNITAKFSKPVDHANISITDSGSPKASNVNLVGTSPVTNALMEPIGDDGKTFGYDYAIPQDISGPLDIGVSGFDDLGNLLGDESFPGGIDSFGVDPYINIISPESEFANEKCVKFNFSAYDYTGYSQTGSQLVYTFELDGVQVNNGVMTSGAYKVLEFDLADGRHTWQVKTVDSMKQEHTTGIRTLYVDTKCPSVTLVSPQDCFKHVIGVPKFTFICADDLAAQYNNDLALSYQLYIDGDIAENSSYGTFSGDVVSGEPTVEELQLPDGVHNWSVSVQDGAGNSVTSEVRKFYVDLNGLTVSTISPNGGYVSKNPTFSFTVKGNSGENYPWLGEESVIPGAGLPFTYKLFVNGKEVKANCDCDCDCNGGYTGDEGEKPCVKCSGGQCDGSCFVVGKDIYSVKAAVEDGINKNWTVIITDSTTGKTYQTDLKTFNVDSVAPARVANLNVVDASGLTAWDSIRDFPGLMVSWNASTDADLSGNPYEVYISTSKPGCIEDMKMVNVSGLETHTDGTDTPNQKLKSSEDKSVWYLCVEALEGKDLVYGKDYWVAVIARDNATNYNSDFARCGPVQTYEDMSITLEQGWNLKSVPKKLVDSMACPEDVFGNGSTVLYWDGSCWQSPKTIEPCKGYWVYAKEPLMTNAKFKGMSSEGANPDVPASLTMTPGWHMIGHTSSYFAPWSTTLASLNEFNTDKAENYKFSNLITYQGNEGWGGIIPGIVVEDGVAKYIGKSDPRPVGALETDNCMVPGQGYWIFMKSEGTYASIENSYKPNIGQEPGDGIELGDFPDDFDPNDEDTWPDWLKKTGQSLPNDFDPNDEDTWPDWFTNLMGQLTQS